MKIWLVVTMPFREWLHFPPNEERRIIGFKVPFTGGINNRSWKGNRNYNIYVKYIMTKNIFKRVKIKRQQLIAKQFWRHSLQCRGHTPIWLYRDIKPTNIDLIKVPDFGGVSCGETCTETSQGRYPFIKYFTTKHWRSFKIWYGDVVF